MVFKSMVSLDINISGVKQKSTAYKDHTFGHPNLIDKYEITKIPRKAVINVQELSNRCFIISLAASLKHTNYESLQEKENPANFARFISENFIIDGLKFGQSAINMLSLSTTLYCIEKKWPQNY